MSARNYFTYELKKVNKVVHRGYTNNLERREQEHQQQFPGSHIIQIGRAKSKKNCIEWDKKMHKEPVQEQSIESQVHEKDIDMAKSDGTWFSGADKLIAGSFFIVVLANLGALYQINSRATQDRIDLTSEIKIDRQLMVKSINDLRIETLAKYDKLQVELKQDREKNTDRYIKAMEKYYSLTKDD